jgi:hypothetical protein
MNLLKYISSLLALMNILPVCHYEVYLVAEGWVIVIVLSTMVTYNNLNNFTAIGNIF